MPESFVIWGCSGHAKVLASLIASRGGRVLAFFDNARVSSIIPDVPVYLGTEGFHAWTRHADNFSGTTGLVAIGGHRGDDRVEILNLFRAAGLNLAPLVHPAAVVCDTSTIGEGSQVLALALVAAGSKVGAACIINHRASVDHECVLGDGVHLAPAATLCGCVTIGYNVMVGAGAVILPRLTVGAGSIIGAGAVVTRDVPERLVIVGNPGRPMYKTGPSDLGATR